MYGTQASRLWIIQSGKFENDVKMYGTQAHLPLISLSAPFENDVKMYGTQAEWQNDEYKYCLRMM